MDIELHGAAPDRTITGRAQTPSEIARFEAARSRTMWQLLTDAAAAHPDRVALVAADDAGQIQRLTYAGLAERVQHLSAGLAQIGIRRGDRVAMWMTNTPEWVVSAFATMRLGAAITPVNTFLTPSEVAYFLRDSGARHLIILDNFRKLQFADMLAEICPGFAEAEVPGQLFCPELHELRNVILFNRSGGSHPGAYDLHGLERQGAADTEALTLSDRLAAAVKPDDLGMVKYTSGSTGFAKGVMLAQGGVIANATLHGNRMGITAADVYFSMMPFFHGGGSIYGLMTMLTRGGKLVFTEAFHAKMAVKLIAEEQADVVVGILANEIVQAAVELGITCPKVRVASGLGDHAQNVFPNVSLAFQAFGLTESYGPACMTGCDDPQAFRRTCGRVLEGYECRVVNPETGEDVPPGTVGEAWIRGNVMKGYWNKPVETARAFTEDGWLRSEDLVTMDADGYFTWIGRLKLMLKVGGENVSLEEVERIVLGHTQIAGCGAVGVQDPRKGEAVGLLVVCRGEKLEESEFRAWLAERLAVFKRPRQIAFVDELPRVGSGKLSRVALNQLALKVFAA